MGFLLKSVPVMEWNYQILICWKNTINGKEFVLNQYPANLKNCAKIVPIHCVAPMQFTTKATNKLCLTFATSWTYYQAFLTT